MKTWLDFSREREGNAFSASEFLAHAVTLDQGEGVCEMIECPGCHGWPDPDRAHCHICWGRKRIGIPLEVS